MAHPNLTTGSIWRLHHGDQEWEQAHTRCAQIRSALPMTFPDGSQVAEFMLHIHDDGTAGWRRHDEPFDTVNQ
ncbi:hypothetical protein [Streptomyces sp. NBC_00557]|uniref:hypothetical protein n=1 Tax=Streptomyces sp. NBC_00557 TaxID=2975776 RepID=UPI002E80C410|nr:hypothetical protein [Streptomyces sp. NBC_00557]WUC34656.1 hypothetical protein OG956_10740 [Streptomyces sp. NBC_00557]